MALLYGPMLKILEAKQSKSEMFYSGMHICHPSLPSLWIKIVSSFYLLAQWSVSWVAAACMMLSPAYNIQLGGRAHFLGLGNWLMHLQSIQMLGQRKLPSTCSTMKTHSVFSVILQWEGKYSTSFFYFASITNLQCRKTMRPLPSLFWKLSFTPDSSQYTINASSKRCSNRQGENCSRALGAGATPPQNADFHITDILTYCSRAAGVLHVTLALLPRHTQTRRPKDLDPAPTTHFASHFSPLVSLKWRLPRFFPNLSLPIFCQGLEVRAYGLPHQKWITCWPDASGASTVTTNMPDVHTWRSSTTALLI